MKRSLGQWSTKHLHIGLPGLESSTKSSTALFSCNILDKGDNIGQGLDGSKIDTDNQTADGHHLGCDLKPSSWGSAQIDEDLGSFKEVVLFVELDQLERRTGTITLLLGHVVVLIQTSYFLQGGKLCQTG